MNNTPDSAPDSLAGYQWSGRKAAVAAVLAIGLSGAGGTHRNRPKDLSGSSHRAATLTPAQIATRRTR